MLASTLDKTLDWGLSKLLLFASIGEGIYFGGLLYCYCCHLRHLKNIIYYNAIFPVAFTEVHKFLSRLGDVTPLISNS